MLAIIAVFTIVSRPRGSLPGTFQELEASSATSNDATSNELDTNVAGSSCTNFMCVPTCAAHGLNSVSTVGSENRSGSDGSSWDEQLGLPTSASVVRPLLGCPNGDKAATARCAGALDKSPPCVEDELSLIVQAAGQRPTRVRSPRLSAMFRLLRGLPMRGRCGLDSFSREVCHSSWSPPAPDHRTTRPPHLSFAPFDAGSRRGAGILHLLPRHRLLLPEDNPRKRYVFRG